MTYKKGDFARYVEFVKESVAQGLCTKEEAVEAILMRMGEIFAELSSEIKLDTKQFMKDRELESLEVN